MSIHIISRWLMLLFIMILLHACGGGAFEESTSESESLSTDTSEITSISASHLSLQQILPSGGSTTVSFTTLIADEDRLGEIAPNIPLKISVHPRGAATLDNVPRSTDHNGDISFTVNHPGSGNVVLNISGSGSIRKGFDIPLYFGASVMSEIFGDSIAPANGTTPLYIRVLARDWAGVGIPNINVGFSFSLNSSAVLVPLLDDEDEPISTTDIRGQFIAGVTNTIPQTTKITPFAGGMSAGPLTLIFSTSNVITTPESLNLVIKSNNVPANGSTSATLVVIARDATGTPVPHIPVHISSDSATAQLNVNDEKYGTLFINGNTGEEGRFELKITNTVEEDVNITATTTSGDEIETTTSQTIVFANPEDVPDSDVKVANIELEVKNNSQSANTEPVYLRGRLLDEAGNPIVNKTVSIIVSGGSAQIELANNGSTDESGRFSATLTDNFAETFRAKAVSGGVSSNEVDVIFTAAKSVEAGGDAVPHSITLLATPEQQIAGSDNISLTAIVYDSNNTPISDVLLTLSATGKTANTLLFENNTVTTEGSGIATFKVSNIVPGTVTIVVTATGGVSTVSKSKSVSFISADEGETGDTRVNVARLDIHVVQNSQPANGEAAIRVDVLAKDNNNRPVKEAPLVVQMSAGLAAKATPARKTTEDDGFFTTNITSTEAGKITVSVAVEGTSVVSHSKTIEFVAIQPGSGTDATPVKIELEVSPDTKRQPADGQSKLTLIATPRSADNTPLAGVEVQLIDESDFVNIEGGPSNALGQYRISVTSEVAETFKVTPVVVSENNSITGVPVFLTFDEVDTGTIDLQIIGNNTQIADGQATIILEVTFRDSNGNPVPGANVTFIADSKNKIDLPKGTTNALGKFRTSVTSTVAEKDIVVTPVVNDIVGESKLITFTSIASQIDELIVNVVRNNQSATGKDEDANQIEVIARKNGSPVAGVPIKVELPQNSKAVVKSAQTATDVAGVFLFNITSHDAGDVNVRVVAEGASLAPVEDVVTFMASVNVTPTDINFEIFNAPQPADGQSAITLVVKPLDANGAPIKEVPIELISDSTTAQINEDTGTTNAIGEFRTTVTNTVAETFNVTPIAGGVPAKKPTSVTFFPVGSPVADLQVTVVKNNQAANGTDTVEIHVTARDNSGVAVSNVPIVVRMPTGTAAVADLTFNGNTNDRGQQVTNESGFFKTQITSTVAGELAVTIAVDGTNIAAPPKPVIFTAIGVPTTPTNVDLRIDNNAQPADGQARITLIVTPRDARGTPIAGVNIQLIKDSDNIDIEQDTGISNVLGEFRTTAVVTQEIAATPLTEALVVNVTPVADGIKGQAEPVIFTPVTAPIPATLTLTVNNIATVNEAISLTVQAKDERNFLMTNIPVKLRAEPVGQPDITGSVVFGQFEGKTAEGTGVFETTIRSGQEGTVNVIAEALNREGGEPILSSNSVTVSFQIPGEDRKEVTSINLITDNPQLGSGSTEGVEITAIVKNKDNNPVEGAVISFSADSGTILPLQMEGAALPGMTDATGHAKASLTTEGNPANRTITVTATVPTITGEPRTDTITIDVTGTVIIVTGPDSITVCNEAPERCTPIDIGIFMRDSTGKGLDRQTLKVTSALGNIIDNPSPMTNASGQATIKLTAITSGSGQDTITVLKEKGDPKEKVISGELVVNISDDNFTLESVPPGLKEINLNTQQRFQIHWDKGETNPQRNKQINISSTRGTLSTENVFTDLNGDAFFSIEANNSGPAIITVTTTEGGPSKKIAVDFIATIADSMTLQANPITIGVNTPESDAQQSDIVAVVRDPENNLVKGKRINFVLQDVTGGRLFPSSAVTDSFGRASTVYFAGTSSSAADGVEVKATVTDTPTVTASVNLTVAAKSLFVTLGSGNKVEIDGPTRYKYPYTVLVTDAAGVAVTNTEVILSVLPLEYDKGSWVLAKIGEDEEWVQIVTSECQNEDTLSSNPINRFNGILDGGLGGEEDLNNNGTLEPSNVATFDFGNVEKTVVTDTNGFADFFIVYSKQFTYWVEVQVKATVTVAGSEGIDTNEFMLPGVAEDYNNPDISPPGRLSPFGVGFEIATTEDTNNNGILDPDEDQLLLKNGILDTEDINGNGRLDPGEDGSIRYIDPVSGTEIIVGESGQLDTEDRNGNGRLDLSEDINRNGILDVTYVNTCNDTD